MPKPRHPLDGAFLRWKRANIHLAEADNLVRDWAKKCEATIVREGDSRIRLDLFPDVPEWLPVVVSDAIHNMRAALDYLVYELSLWDSYGHAENLTQFPIESDPSSFDGRRDTYLKGLNGRHVGLIEALQPYKRVEWTKTLQAISNPDKHRHLSVVTIDSRGALVRIHWGPEGRFMTDKVEIGPDGPVALGFDPEVDGHQTIAITIPKRGETALMPTLRRLEAEVCDVLERFRPEFI